MITLRLVNVWRVPLADEEEPPALGIWRREDLGIGPVVVIPRRTANRAWCLSESQRAQIIDRVRRIGSNGDSFASIARDFGITRQSVRELALRHAR